jgi:AcrR family transcriptional regulator
MWAVSQHADRAARRTGGDNDDVQSETGTAATPQAEARPRRQAGERPDGSATGRAEDDGAGPDAPRRRGRRPGGADTRAALLAAARTEFAQRGYDGATVRMIAERAGVDPAMVNHWFGGKEALFSVALELPVNPAALVAELLPGDPEQLGERIVARFLTVWDQTGGGPLAAVMRSIASHEDAARMLREFIGTVLVGRLVTKVAPDRADLRAGLVGSQLFGMGLLRYVLKLEPLASAEHGVVIGAVAPTLQRYLTGPLP